MPEQVSVISPLGLGFALLMGLLLLVLPRRLALVPIALITCYMTFGQRVVIAGLDFTMLRILVLFACARIVLRNEFRAFRWSRLDTVMLAWACANLLAYTLLRQSSAAFINRLGVAYDAIGLYFVFRFLLRDLEDLKRACRLFALVLVPVMLLMFMERITARNMFALFGGVPEFTLVRDGMLRCQGPFRHPILAGTFGAVWMPFFVGLWWQGQGNRFHAVLGIISSTAITFLSASSGPVGTYIAGLAGLAFWPLRNQMQKVRWAFLVTIISLHIVMKAPVWFLLARVKIFGGSTAWHRANVVDKTIANFSDWWLLGTKDPGLWRIHHGDMTNHFARVAVDGGLLALILFVYLVVLAFSNLGRAMKAVRSQSPRHHRLLWAAGSVLFAHVITFFGVSYFDQNVVNWYFLLAFSATIVSLYCRRIVSAHQAAPELAPAASHISPRIQEQN